MALSGARPRWRRRCAATSALLLGIATVAAPAASFVSFAAIAAVAAQRCGAPRAPRRAATAEDAVQGASGGAVLGAAKGFDWAAQWYPAAVAADLDRGAPHGVTILGEDLVLWHDGVAWACAADRCPHRLAPLSEGRLSGETPARLQCSYHGWEFDREGACLRIPQAASAEVEESALRSRRSCVQAYPVGEAAGLLWVWADSAPGAVAAAAATPLPLPAAARARLEAGQPLPDFFMRDLPYGHDILLENLVDPSHLPFSHHGFGGLRRETVTAGHRMEMVGNATALHALFTKEHGVGFPALRQLDRVVADAPTALARTKSPFGAPDNMAGFVHFTAPTRVVYEYLGDVSILLFATPTAPGAARVFLVNLLPPPATALPLRAELQRRFRRLVFSLMTGTFLGKYRAHMMDHTIFDGDGIFLAAQQHKLHQEDGRGQDGGGSWRSYFTPGPADALVIAMRRWYEGQGGGQPPWRGAH
ncbi:unnamed protein product, partial [Polarella glacialis]